MSFGIRSHDTRRKFILQQGFPEPPAATCAAQYSALVFQPRLIGLVLLAGVLMQEPRVFFALAALLWWCAAFPRWNPFDALYNALWSRRPGRIALSPAPAPRRFAQSLAGTFALGIGISLRSGWHGMAVALECLLMAAVAALAFGGFCLGSFLFHLIRGRVAFALRTLPWVRSA